MIIIVGVIVVAAGLFALLAAADNKQRKDDRQPYIRNSNGLAYALMVRGPVGRVPNHEQFIHDGTPHENPVVQTQTVTKRFLWIVPYPVEIETRHYPLNFNDMQGPNFARINADVHRARAKGQDVAIVLMDEEIERRANIVENQTQEGKGHDKLKFNRRGKPI